MAHLPKDLFETLIIILPFTVFALCAMAANGRFDIWSDRYMKTKEV